MNNIGETLTLFRNLRDKLKAKIPAMTGDHTYDQGLDAGTESAIDEVDEVIHALEAFQKALEAVKGTYGCQEANRTPEAADGDPGARGADHRNEFGFPNMCGPCPVED